MIDDNAVGILKERLVSVMMHSPKRIADVMLETISIMARRNIHNDWQNLVQVRESLESINHLSYFLLKPSLTNSI